MFLPNSDAAFWVAVASFVCAGFCAGMAAHMFYVYCREKRAIERRRKREGIFSLETLLDEINERDDAYYW